MSDVTIRPIQEPEFSAWARTIADAQGRDHVPGAVDRARRMLSLDRSLGAFDRGVPVGGAALSPREMTLPGGVREDVAAVQWTGVAPTHRRRGIFTALMRQQLSDLYEYRREPITVLTTRHGANPARFGYGVASQVLVMHGDIREVTFRADVKLNGGRVVLLEEEHARPLLESIHQRARSMNVGWVEREAKHWDALLDDVRTGSGAFTAGRIVVHLDSEDNPLGYAIFRYEVRHDDVSRDVTRLHVVEVVAVRRQAHTTLWRFLLDLDGARQLRAEGALDEPLQLMLADPSALTWSVADRLSVRLVDVARALAVRRYSSPVDVVIEVRDPFCEWNEGRFRLQGDQHGADCARATAPADLVCSVADLAAAYLGGTSLMSLALAGRVEARSTGALQNCSVAFKGFREPSCPASQHWPMY
ncbi:GNAT family N-acetyltransferase [Aestuariimicrobium ganziense]|uniref:GNAT family N-acetyltransferase n=1 Tax=Aestuariimicrobium ganziense TaxID=2773677 RepID=UPI001944DA75|nr:GNAT family N-acetyltransferase [Aestuariimicrobium ganziense]